MLPLAHLCMTKTGKLITLKVGTLNCRGLRNTGKRRTIARQIREYCDVWNIQDTHLDTDLCNQFQKEVKGHWAFHNRSNCSGGVALHTSERVRSAILEDCEAYDNEDGSLIGRTVKMEDYSIYCISAYAPCCDQSSQRRAKNLKFLTQLEKLVMAKRMKGLEVIVCGDLNFIRNDWLDADGGNPTVYKEQADWLAHFEDNCGMYDAFRFLRPDERMYTWSRTQCFRRLDYILCSRKLLECAKETAIIPVPSSDHRLLAISFELGRDTVSGPGMWRHNDSLLSDNEYMKVITDCINEVKSQQGQFKDRTSQWEYCKFRVRETAIKFGKARAKEHRKEKARLTEIYLKALEKDDDQEEITQLRKQLHKVYEEEDEVIRFRTGLNEIEKGEKVTPFFFRTIERNREESNVTKLITEDFPNGTVSKKETMDEIEKHFKATFADKDKNKDTPEDWFEGLKRVPEEVSEKLDKPVTLNDITNALFKLVSEGKSPGNDGLTTTFCRAFWSEIKDMVMDSLKEGEKRGEFSNSQRQSVIRLIEKQGKSREKMNGWRPISLMNIDVKLYSKVLAERLKTVCKEVIGDEQLAYLSGNDIHEGHLLLNRALEMARKKKISGLLCCIDFKAAFDSVRHKFIFTSLKHMGVGDKLINMLKTLYSSNQSAVMNFGTTTNRISLERSCRQGDPVSAYLFILGMEILLNKLRKLKLGMKLGQISLWSTAFADDITLLMRSNKDLRAALKILNEYKQVSGLEINFTKSEVLEMNYKYDTSIGIPLTEKVKITGIHFSMSEEVMIKSNWDEVYKKIASKLGNWKGRALSEVGRSVIVKAQIAPIILYVSTVIPIPKEYEKSISRLTYMFIGKNSEKEGRALLCKPKDQGGLDVPNWGARCASAMALWIVKANSSKKPWADLVAETGIDWKSQSALVTIRSNHGVEGFMGKCVDEYYKTVSLLPRTSEEAFLWPYMQQPAVSNMLRKKSPNLTLEQAKLELPNNLNFLEKSQIQRGLVQAEKNLKKQCDYMAFESRQSIQKNLKCIKWPKPKYDSKGELREIGMGRLKTHQDWLRQKRTDQDFGYLNSLRSIYKLQIDNIVPPPHPFRNKVDAEYGPLNWDLIDKQRFSTYTKAQAFQWRSTHGKLYANKHFKAMGVKESAKCSFCEEESQTLKHMFIECKVTKNLFACFERKYTKEAVSSLEKLIGFDPEIIRTKLEMKKLGILRQMIYSSNHKGETPRWESFIDQVEKVYTYEYSIADRNGRVLQHLKIWEK